MCCGGVGGGRKIYLISDLVGIIHGLALFEFLLPEILRLPEQLVELIL